MIGITLQTDNMATAALRVWQTVCMFLSFVIKYSKVMVLPWYVDTLSVDSSNFQTTSYPMPSMHPYSRTTDI